MQKLSTDELRRMNSRGERFALLNVLPGKQFEETRIPGATNAPLEDPDFVAQAERTIGDKQRTVVVYCASETCPASTRAAERLEAAGFTDVHDYKGGAAAWQESEEAASRI